MFRENLEHGVKVFGSTVLAAVMCFFVCFSFSFLSVAMLTKDIGYTVFSIENNTTETELYTYYYTDGEDTRYAEYEAQGLALKKVTLNSQLTTTQRTVTNVLSQIFCILIFIITCYAGIWKLGASDSNKVKFGHIKQDNWRGVKIGALAAIPTGIVYVLFVLSRFGAVPQLFFTLYKLLNYAFGGYLNILFGSVTNVMDVPVWKIFPASLTVLALPIICGVIYRLGYKDISISEKLIYKKGE